MNGERVQRVEAALARMPYAGFLGLRARLAGDELTIMLPYSDPLIGNPNIPAIHGGVLGALMEITAMTELAMAEGLSRQPRPIDVAIDYLRSGRPLDTFARAQIKRLGRRVANVHVEAWQESRTRPIASLHGHFHVTPILAGKD
jgi:uncharacterized protein (TIGR00369 family)